MRLIDADKLKAKVRAQEWKRDPTIMLALNWIYMLIDNSPTIDAVPVVCGEWMQKHHIISFNNMTLTGTYPTCNLCDYAEVGMAKKSNFCPNCGADMRGETE